MILPCMPKNEVSFVSQMNDKLTTKIHDMLKKCANDSSSSDCDELNFLQKKV